MVSSIQLGNFYSSGSRTLLGGAGGSGIDTQTIVDALVKARQVPVKALEDQVALDSKKNAAFSSFQSLVGKLNNAADLLRQVPGFAKESGNAFDATTASITSNTAIPGSTYVEVTASPGTAAQSHVINSVTFLAKAKQQATDVFAIATADTAVVDATPGVNQFGAGTLTIQGATITLADGDTLNNVAAKFNAASGTTGIGATVIKISDNSFKLLFTATETGEAADFDLTDPLQVTDPGNVLQNITGGGASFDDSVTLAQNAKFTIDNQLIERQNNIVSDAISGITFNLQQLTPGGTTLNVNIVPDTTVVKNGIINFMNAYNDLRTFYAEQTQLKSDGTYADTAVLAIDPILQTVMSQLSNEVTRIVGGIGATQLRQLGDVGVSFANVASSTDADGNVKPGVRNVLNLDETKLDAALASKFEQVRALFSFTLTSNNPNLAVYTRSNALGANDFTLNINPGASTYQATYTDSGGSHTIDLDATAFSSGGGYTLKGQAGTALEGLTLLYASTATASISVTASQGIGDRLFNLTSGLLESNTGAIAVQTEAVKTHTDKVQKDITAMNTQLEAYRQQLLDKYARLEQAIAKANSIMQTLSAQSDARNSNN